MAIQLTPDDARQSLTVHVEMKGIEVFIKYGPLLGWNELQQLLADGAFVRYPCTVVFDASLLLPGECAHPVQKGVRPKEGFTMAVHPLFMLDLRRVPALVLYQLVAVNYGDFASAHDAETFGAAALGLTRDEYYEQLCALAAELDASTGVNPEASAPTPGDCRDVDGGGCSCG